MKDLQVCLGFVHKTASAKLWHILLAFLKKEQSGAQFQALPAFALKTFT